MRPAWQIKGALEVPCPYCKVEKGKRCRTGTGNILQRPHAARIKSADKPLLKWKESSMHVISGMWLELETVLVSERANNDGTHDLVSNGKGPGAIVRIEDITAVMDVHCTGRGKFTQIITRDGSTFTIEGSYVDVLDTISSYT
jgi:hypothetical protein